MAHHDDGLGHKLRSLLPLSRHATFSIRLTIHDVTNIPFVQGSFAVRWKFRSVKGGGGRSSSSRPELSRTSTSMTLMTSTTTQATRRGADNETDAATPSDVESIWRNRAIKPLTSAEKGKAKAADEDVDENGVMVESMISEASGISHGESLVSGGTSHGISISNGSSTTLTNGRGTDSAEKGCTAYNALEDHSVLWDQTVEVRADMKIRKDTRDLQPCELKLELRERSVRPSASAGTPEVPVITRFGILDLNLAEYAGLGPVTRRYLLGESNTNATLKLTIEAMHTGGEKIYKVPPLQKGQQVAGVAGVLASDHLKPMLHLYNNASQPLLRSSTPNGLLPSSRPHLLHAKTSLRGSQRSLGGFVSDNAQQTAENVIEAIFNPWPSASSIPSPFTIFTPPHTAAPSISASASASGSNSIRHSERGSTAGTQITQAEDTESLAVSHSDMESSVDQHGTNGKAYSNLSASQTSSTTPANGAPQVGWWRRLGGSHANLAKTRSATPPMVIVPGMAGITNPHRRSTDSAISGTSASLGVPGRMRMSSSRADSSSSAWTDVADYSLLPTPTA
ncbi:hypothetical protein FRB96_004326 [Tulasnella sp. 330]|nr:hypothetical protein FRB96_004326 [Tulasnella sp. 330]